MKPTGRLDGMVVLVTGAARGLDRTHCVDVAPEAPHIDSDTVAT